MSDLFNTFRQPPSPVFEPADSISEGRAAISLRTGAIRNGSRAIPEAICSDSEELEFNFLDSELNSKRLELICERSEFNSERSEFAEERSRRAGTNFQTLPNGPGLAAVDVHYWKESPRATAARVGFIDESVEAATVWIFANLPNQNFAAIRPLADDRRNLDIEGRCSDIGRPIYALGWGGRMPSFRI